MAFFLPDLIYLCLETMTLIICLLGSMTLINRLLGPRTPETPLIRHPVGYQILFEGANPIIAE